MSTTDTPCTAKTGRDKRQPSQTAGIGRSRHLPDPRYLLEPAKKDKSAWNSAGMAAIYREGRKFRFSTENLTLRIQIKRRARFRGKLHGAYNIYRMLNDSRRTKRNKQGKALRSAIIQSHEWKVTHNCKENVWMMRQHLDRVEIVHYREAFPNRL